MSELNPMAEAAALAETLRATIANLDAHIEQRAQAIIAERRPSTNKELIRDTIHLVEQVGENVRQTLMRKVPEGAEHVAKIPAYAFTSTAARLITDICDRRARDAETTGERG